MPVVPASTNTNQYFACLPTLGSRQTCRRISFESVWPKTKRLRISLNMLQKITCMLPPKANLQGKIANCKSKRQSIQRDYAGGAPPSSMFSNSLEMSGDLHKNRTLQQVYCASMIRSEHPSCKLNFSLETREQQTLQLLWDHGLACHGHTGMLEPQGLSPTFFASRLDQGKV